MQAEQRQKITGYFIEEAKEHLETIEQGIAEFQSTIDDPEMASEVYRAAHSIKGGAAMLELESIRRTAHRLEDYFKLLKETPVRVDKTLQSLCTQILNGLKELVGELERTFTVSEAIAARVLSAIEPVFEQTQTHLESLLHPVANPQISTTAGHISRANGSTPTANELDDASLSSADFLDTLIHDLDFGSDRDLPTPQSSSKTSRTPEVGAAELSTLANLFAASELETSLQDDDITLIQSSRSDSSERNNALSFEESESADFADLFEEIGDRDRENNLFGEESEDEDISGFLDQLTSTSPDAVNSQQESGSSSGDRADAEFNFLGELAGANATPPASNEADSSLDELFGAGYSFDESDVEDIPAVSADLEEATRSERDGRGTGESFDPDLDALLSDLGTVAPEAEDSEQQIPQLGEDLSGMGDLFDSLDALEVSEDFSLDTFIQPEGSEDFSLDTFVQPEGSEDFSLDTLTQPTGNEDFSLDTFVQPEGSEDFSLDTLTQPIGNEDFLLDTLIQDLGESSEVESDNFLETLSQDLGMGAGSEESQDINATLEDLLSDGEGDRATNLAQPKATEASDALTELFGASAPEAIGAERIQELEETAARVRETEAIAELSEPSVVAPPAAVEREAQRKQTAVSPTAAVETSLIYYDHLDELESLLDTAPPDPIEEAALFAQLEVQLEILPAQPLLEIESELFKPAVSRPSVSSSEDDGFSDLEELLKDIERQVGVSPTNIGERPRLRPRASTVVEQTIKVPVKQMDNLNNLMGELVVNRNSLEGDEDKLRQSLDTLMHQVQNLSDVAGRMQDLYERSLLEDALLKSRQEYRQETRSQRGIDPSVYTSSSANTSAETKEGYSALEMDSFSKFHELAQETIELIVRVRESASDINLWVDDIDLVARSLRQTTSQLQEGLTKARMVPFSRTADRLPLAVKKICPQLQKEAQLQVEGKETLIDKMILEHLSDPLTHLVNNSLTHGIELPEERIAKGKRPIGQITVRALQQGNQTVISVSDDGAGIDPQRVKAKAIATGLKTPAEVDRMTEVELYELLFHPGFSTKDKADNFAGRGVGLDVVRTSISDIRGNVNIESQLGKGTTFTIRLPLTLSISKALCCVSENSPMAFPMDGVEDMLDLPQSHIQTTPEGYQFIQWRDVKLHYCPLSELLTYHRKIGRGSLYVSGREDNMVSVVVLRSATSFLAIGVDQVIGEQEIVIKQIVGPVPKPAGIAGATVQGDGRIMAIADVIELIQIAEGRMRKDTSPFWQDRSPGEASGETEQTQPMVLIVDDSITVRSLLSMTFEKAGYQVEQARDGQDAWEKLRGGLPCDIVFCDIEMPRVDGLELLGRLQKDEQLNPIPVAMLTSRGAERHRRVAAELGASGYFTKPYLEEVLLDAAQRMIDGEVLLPGSSREPGQKRLKAAPKPLEQAGAAPPQPALQLEVQQTPKVLIVDDSVTVRSLLAMTFEGAGYEVAQARDGQDAWNQLTSGLKPDVAFFDIEMPRMDGIQLLERIQQNETLREIPVAMITSRGAQKMKQRAAERGASGYFTKPYVEQELLEAAQRLRNGEVLLANSTRQPRSAPTAEPAPQPPATPTLTELPAQPKVLIVDDSVTVRSLLAMTFEGAGYEVAQARDGQDALKQLQSGLKTDVIFLDIEMPRMDGITLLSNLQADESLKNIPVAMLTSRGAKKMKQRAAESGAKGYFVKPYIDEVLLDAARRLIAGEVLLAVEA